MPGGLLQLVSRGAQDLLLTGNPSVSFYKKVYKTYTNFAMESLRMSIDKNFMSVSETTQYIARIKRHGDLLQDMYISLQFPRVLKKKDGSDTFEVFQYVKNLGEVMLKQFAIYVGGTRIDQQNGEWLHLWNELSMSSDKRYGYDRMIGNLAEMFSPDNYNALDEDEEQIASYRVFVPLRFWFNRNPGLALPLIALQYHDVELHLELRPFRELYTINGHAPTDEEHARYFGSRGTIEVDPYVELNYVFLDTAERNFFANASHDYLVEQISLIETENVSRTTFVELPLTNPVKEIVWCFSRNDAKTNNSWFVYTDQMYTDDAMCRCTDSEIMEAGTILFNGLERLEKKDAAYFNLIQPYQHHRNIPPKGIYCYSFSLNPEHFQPSGACNWSRIRNVQLVLDRINREAETPAEYDVRVYVVRYNFLRIIGGLGGLAYA